MAKTKILWKELQNIDHTAAHVNKLRQLANNSYSLQMLRYIEPSYTESENNDG